MSTERSAGILLFRRTSAGLEVLLVHPGGPYWVGRDEGAWSIPKGRAEPDEPFEAAARREFQEETGHEAKGALAPLGKVRMKSGKLVVGFALEGDWDPTTLRSNTFEAEWPPRSGRIQAYPEVDRADFFPLEQARSKLLEAQRPFLDRLVALLEGGVVVR